MDKRVVIKEAFSKLSKFYDILIYLLTLGRIKSLQIQLLKMIKEEGNRLDVGTGTGEILKKSQNRGFKIGIDISFEMLKVAKRKCKDALFLLADAENMPFKDSLFDTIILSLTYRHLPNRDAFLREVGRILKTEGEIAILDVSKGRFSTILTILMKYFLKPFASLLLGRERWAYFIHSLDKAPTLSEVIEELNSYGFRVKAKKLKYFGLIYLLVAQRKVEASLQIG